MWQLWATKLRPRNVDLGRACGRTARRVAGARRKHSVEQVEGEVGEGTHQCHRGAVRMDPGISSAFGLTEPWRRDGRAPGQVVVVHATHCAAAGIRR
jgi:hypothetical protein